jgi:hypothetical protein
MVIPLTLEALILRKKNKNKRKMMMYNITNTMCRLSDLSQREIDRLRDAMPKTHHFTRRKSCSKLGFNWESKAGFWNGDDYTQIVTYAEMMQLLGKDMNKQTAQEQIAVMQIEMDKLKAIINKPEAKTGRVMSGGDLKYGAQYFYTIGSVNTNTFRNDSIDRGIITVGAAFHDKETAKRHLEYLKLEQELRRAQAADGGEGVEEKYNVILNNRNGKLTTSHGDVYHEKVAFNTQKARDAFKKAHSNEQIILLIRGV